MPGDTGCLMVFISFAEHHPPDNLKCWWQARWGSTACRARTTMDAVEKFRIPVLGPSQWLSDYSDWLCPYSERWIKWE